MIKDLQKQPFFQKAMIEIRDRRRPTVKKFDPNNPNAVEEWKYECARQEGFDLLYLILTGEVND